MESNMIQYSSSSSGSTKWKHDVFVSFRGEDIRNSFADHLFGALRREGILYVFRDERDIKQGDHVSTELMAAIEGSQVLIPVFSKNYATSSWCLDELAMIADCINREVPTGQHVVPVFYDVSPSEVRKQSGDYFGKAFAVHEHTFKHDLGMLQRWRQALVKVSSVSGFHVQNKREDREIKKIVKNIKSLLGSKSSISLDGLVGMYSRIEQIEKLLAIDSDNDNDVRVIGICGMGGIGKTTLATVVYGKIFHKFDASCFIDDVNKVYHDGGLIAAQKQLICQTLKEDVRDIWNIFEATSLIKNRLFYQKTLIVLDNVHKVEQLDKLGVNRKCLRTGSRMIIVSRDRHILDTYGVDEVYDSQLLNDDETHQLFCRKAFKHDKIMNCDSINKEYQVLTNLALKYAQGLPLAIEVLGSFLYGRDISQWRSALDRLKDNPKKEIMEVLQISFDGLELMEKEIFLDIACFLSSYPSVGLHPILNYRGFHPEIEIQVLLDKSLINKNQYDHITMHDKLQELGKNIVRQQAPNEPRKWSRIWCQEDFRCLMYEMMDMDNIEAMVLGPPTICNKENTTLLRAEALSRMNRLKLLIFRGVNFSGSLSYLSRELQYLEWNYYPFTYFPSCCELINLVELYLVGSSLKQLWEGIKPLYKLRVMDLRRSNDLVRTPDLSGAPNLVKLFLQGCTNLEHIHPSTGFLLKLVYLDLENCKTLTSLPNISNLTSLEYLNLKDCSKALQAKQLSEKANLKHIDTSNTAVIQCQSRSSFFKRLKLMLPPSFRPHYDDDDSSRLNDNNVASAQMPSLARFYCLQYLNLSYCSLVNIPECVASLSCLEMLYLEGNNFVTLPCFIRKLPRLTTLMLDQCKELTYLSVFPLGTCFQVERLEQVALRMFNCSKFVEMESLSCSAVSWMIQVLKVHKESSPKISIVIPATQIPTWFDRESVGDSITIGLFPNVHDSNWIGIAFCARLVAHFRPTSRKYVPQFVSIRVRFHQMGNHDGIIKQEVIDVKETEEVTVELVHLWLLYFTRQELTDYYMQIEKAKRDVDHFCFTLSLMSFYPKDFHLEVKNCGVRVVFKHHLQQLIGDE